MTSKRKSPVKKWIISTGTVILAGVAIAIWYGGMEEGSVGSISNEVSELDGLYHEEKLEQLSKELDELSSLSERLTGIHDNLNRITGYGKYDSFRDDDPDYEENWLKIEAELDLYADYAEAFLSDLDEEIMRQDLNNFAEITRFASDTWHVQYLLYSHRIIHDLDTVYNDVEDKDVFGAAKFVKTADYEPRAYHGVVQQILQRIEEDRHGE